MSPPQKKPDPKCPICGKSAAAELRPFCSRRCADVDLSRWLNGNYAIAGGNSDADEDGDAIVAPQPVRPTNGTHGAAGDEE